MSFYVNLGEGIGIDERLSQILGCSGRPSGATCEIQCQGPGRGCRLRPFWGEALKDGGTRASGTAVPPRVYTYIYIVYVYMCVYINTKCMNSVRRYMYTWRACVRILIHIDLHVYTHIFIHIHLYLYVPSCM